MIDAIRRRGWRTYADLRAHRSRAAATATIDAVFGGVDRSDVDAWTDATAAGHDDYRGRVEPATGAVAVVCVTRRPHLLDDVAHHVARQDASELELVVVTHDESFGDVDVRGHLDGIGGAVRRVRVLDGDPSSSLGACLNAAMDATDARFVAKFDDDDLYWPSYLTDALRAHSYAGAGVVGKHSYYAWLAQTDELLLRFPGNEFRSSSTLAGGTLVIDRSRTGDLDFADLSLGEDRAFIAACHRRGISTFAADRFNFVQVRSTGHSWQPTREEFVRRSRLVGTELDPEVVDR